MRTWHAYAWLCAYILQWHTCTGALPNIMNNVNPTESTARWRYRIRPPMFELVTRLFDRQQQAVMRTISFSFHVVNLFWCMVAGLQLPACPAPPAAPCRERKNARWLVLGA